MELFMTLGVKNQTPLPVSELVDVDMTETW